MEDSKLWILQSVHKFKVTGMTISESLETVQTRITKIIQGIIVIAKSFVAFAVLLQTVFVIYAAQFADSQPGWARVAVVVAGGLGAAATAVRKVTPSDTTGVLPS